MVKTRRQKAEEAVTSGEKELQRSNQEPIGKKSKNEEEEEPKLPFVAESQSVNFNLENDGPLEILDGEDDHDENSELAIGEVVTPDFLLERLLILKHKTFDNFFSGNFVGIDCRFNADGSNSERLRGLILMKTAKHAQSLVQNKEFSSYRNLFYELQSLLPKLAAYVAKMESQIRPNVRLIERIIKVPRNSLPYAGRPNGFVALGESVNLSIGGKIVGASGEFCRLPFGNHHVEGLGNFASNAKLIVVVESHGEMENMISGGLLSKAKNTIILAACGNPDLGFRAVLSKMSVDLKIPVKFLVDCDLPGFMIAAQLAFGSFSFDFKDHLKYMTPQISPIGILPQDILDSDKSFSDLTTSEDSAINVLRNKWRSHNLELTQSQQFWEEICLGFEEISKKMSLAQARQNRGRMYNVDQVVAAETAASQS